MDTRGQKQYVTMRGTSAIFYMPKITLAVEKLLPSPEKKNSAGGHAMAEDAPTRVQIYSRSVPMLQNS